MRLLYLNSRTFLAREVVNALRKRGDIRTTIADIAPKTAPESAREVYEQLRPHLPAVVLSVNNAGYDLAGSLEDLLLGAGCSIVNWFSDDPWYERTIYGARMQPSPHRIDFVTEESFVPQLRAEGLNAYFLPLAVDPAFFTTEGNVPLERDVAFVGNSTMEFIDPLITDEVQRDFERVATLVNEARLAYAADPALDINAWLQERSSLWTSTVALPADRFLFIAQWLIGYWHRRDFIVEIARRYGPRFTCFGDVYWRQFIDPSQVSASACYYDNLCRYYRSTRVNLNINRVQIRTSFTQRIFDCKASGAFLLTDRRALNSRFFVTRGPDRELVEFTSPTECIALIDYYLAHEEERRAIAAAGREKVVREHTYDRRMEEIIAVCRQQWGL